MFEELIRDKTRVKVYCGQDTGNHCVMGVITKHFDKLGLIQVGNVLLPIEWIAKIEVLDNPQPT